MRLMVLKQRYRWGYRTLVAEVSDSIHLRRFCRISLSERVPDESTVRKLTRRIGAETVAEMTRALIVKATRETAVSSAGGADRLDGDRGRHQASDGRGAGIGRCPGAGEGGSQAGEAGWGEAHTGAGSLACDGTEAAGDRAHDPPALWSEAKGEVLNPTKQTGELLERAIREARRLAAVARRKARGRSARAKLTAARRLEELADRCEKVGRQIRQRITGEAITAVGRPACRSG